MTESITTIRVEDCYPNPRHYRDEIRSDNVKRLAANMEEAGQLEPIRVWQDGSIYYIDAGHHRHAAAELLGWQTIDAIVSDPSVSAMVASNMHVPESELEKSRGTQLLMSTGVVPEAAAKLVGIDADTASRVARAIEVVNDETAAEDLTIDRFLAIEEVADDADAVKAILNATEKDWRGVHQQFVRVRKTAEAVAECERIISAAGVEVMESGGFVHHEGFSYLGDGNEKPEGATHAKVTANQWNSAAAIYWYAAVDPEQVSAEEAERSREAEERDRLKAAHQAASDARTAFWIAELAGEHPGTPNAVRDAAWSLWRAGWDASTENVPEGVTGDLSCFYASVLALVEDHAHTLLSGSIDRGYGTERFVANMSEYIEALVECGYEPSDIESLDELRAELEEADDE